MRRRKWTSYCPKIKTGMSEEEVVGILGKPMESTSFGNLKILAWQKSNKGIIVYLQDGKVSQKMMADLKDGKVDFNGQNIDLGGGNGFMGGGPGRR